MEKIAIAAAAAFFVLPLSSFAAGIEEKPVLPVGRAGTDTIRLEVGDVSDGISLFEDDSYDEEHTQQAEFYNYGSYYAYKDFEQRSNPKARQKIYTDILENCKQISISGRDLLSIETIGNSISSQTIKEYSEQFVIIPRNITIDELNEIYFMFRNDHPEYYWLPSVCYYVESKDSILLMLMLSDEYNEADERSYMDSVIEANVMKCITDIYESEPRTDQQTVKLVYDYIAGLVEYGFDETGQPLDTAYAHSITGVFDGDPETDVVCEGYAKAFQLILNALDIDNIYVTGNAYNGVEWGGHAWNMVRMDDGQYYNFDITWDDSGNTVTYRYFAAGSWFNKDHVPGSSEETSVDFLYELPQVPNKDYEIEDPYLANMECEAAATENGTYTFEVEFDDHVENSIAVAACYDSQGRLIEIKMVEVNGTHAEINGVEVGTDAADVTVMAWLDGSNTPIAPCVEFNVASSEEDQ